MSLYRITEESHIDFEMETTFNQIRSLKHTAPLHTHTYFEFFLITKGKCSHIANDHTQILFEGALVFIRPDDKHYYEFCGEEDCEILNIACKKKAILDAFEYLDDKRCKDRLLYSKLPPYSILSPEDRANILGRYEKMKILSLFDKKMVKIQLRGMITEILSQFFYISSDKRSKDMPQWFRELLLLMNKRENFIEGVSRMKELTHLSGGHLCRTFRKHLDITPTEHINQIRICHAKNLILMSDLSIMEAAFESGFNNISHFYHVFKNHMHISPGELRKNGQVN